MTNIIFLGDSITDANHNFSIDILGEGYVKKIGEVLQNDSKNVRILNKGHDGFTIQGLKKFLEYDCLSKNPDIVSILIGCNDVGIRMSTGRTLEERKFQETYEKILGEIISRTNAKIICMGPFIFPEPLEFAKWIPEIKKAELMTAKAAEKYNVIFCPLHDLLQDEAKKAGYEKITTDGIHLTEDGAAVIAGKWLELTGNWLDKNTQIS